MVDHQPAAVRETGVLRRLVPAGVLAVLLPVLSTLGGCGGDGPGDATGRYELDRPAYARELVVEALAARAPNRPADPEAMETLRRACVERARSIHLTLELRGDGAFVARYRDEAGEQSMGGTWTTEGAMLVFRTTRIPGGRVRDLPVVRARLEDGVLVFERQADGWAVPQPFRLRRVAPPGGS